MILFPDPVAFRKALGNALLFANSFRATLATVQFNLDQDGLTLVSTDSYTLFRQQIGVEVNAKNPATWLLGKEHVKRMHDMLPAKPPPVVRTWRNGPKKDAKPPVVSLKVLTKRFTLEVGQSSVGGPLDESAYPEYTTIFAKQKEAPIDFVHVGLWQLARLAKIKQAQKKVQPVKFTFGGDPMGPVAFSIKDVGIDGLLMPVRPQ